MLQTHFKSCINQRLGYYTNSVLYDLFSQEDDISLIILSVGEIKNRNKHFLLLLVSVIASPRNFKQMQQKKIEKHSLSNLVVLGTIGRGSTSHVFKAQSTMDKKLYAMKVFDKKSKKYNYPALVRELELHRQLKHQNIVELISHIQDCDNHYVLTEYCEGGDMTKKLKENLNEQAIAGMMFQIVQGLKYLHSQGIAHCDLKLNNLLLQKNKIVQIPLPQKICDFGYSRRISEGPSDKLSGTIFYMAPEILKEKKRILHAEADIWALGICVLILLTKKQPYQGSNFKEIVSHIVKGERTPLPSVSTELQDLMKKMLEQDPQVRITLEQIEMHPFICQYKKNSHECLNKQLQQDNTNRVTKVPRPVQQSQLSLQRFDFGSQIKEQDLFISEKSQTSEEKWCFRRPKKAQSEQDDCTTQKKSSLVLTSDNNATIKRRASSKDLFKSTQIKNPEQTLSKIIKKPLSLIQAKLICPLSQFHYSTKNQGYIKINPSGELTIKVKGVVYNIIEQGQTIKIGKSSFKLDEINQHRQEESYKHPYELYEYAQNVIDIFKSKKYTWEKLFVFKNKQVIIGEQKEKNKFVCLTGTNNKDVLLEYNSQKDQIRFKFQGQKWTYFDQKGEQNYEISQIIAFFLQKIASTTNCK